MKAFEDKSYPKFEEGMQFVVVGYDVLAAELGGIVTLVGQDDSICPRFEDSKGRTHHLYWAGLAPLEPLSDEPHPEVPEGTKFLCLEGYTNFFPEGEIVTLHDNDGSCCPSFMKEDGSTSWYSEWARMAPLTRLTEVPEEKVEVSELIEAEAWSCGKLTFGVRPRWLLDKERMLELLEAMTRYADAGKSIPQEWIEELEELNASL